MATVEKRAAKTTDNNANQTGYYINLAFLVILGLCGTFLRFVIESPTMSMISNLLLLIAAILTFRLVFKIIK